MNGIHDIDSAELVAELGRRLEPPPPPEPGSDESIEQRLRAEREDIARQCSVQARARFELVGILRSQRGLIHPRVRRVTQDMIEPGMLLRRDSPNSPFGPSVSWEIVVHLSETHIYTLGLDPNSGRQTYTSALGRLIDRFWWVDDMEIESEDAG